MAEHDFLYLIVNFKNTEIKSSELQQLVSEKKCYFEKSKFSLKNIYLTYGIHKTTFHCKLMAWTCRIICDGNFFSTVKLDLTNFTRYQLQIVTVKFWWLYLFFWHWFPRWLFLSFRFVEKLFYNEGILSFIHSIYFCWFYESTWFTRVIPKKEKEKRKL